MKIIETMSELNAEQLMAVYRESNFNDYQLGYGLRNAEDAFLSYLREDFFRQKNALYAVWIVSGIYRSALRLEPYKDGLLLEALETAPDARRNGFAYQLMKSTISFLRSTKWRRVYSHRAKHNTPSICAHTKCGFQRISESATYIDGTVTQNSATYCVEL